MDFLPGLARANPGKKSASEEDEIPRLYFTDLTALRRSVTIGDVVHELSAAAIAAAESSGLVDGMPFILGRDDSYDHDLNRFFRACPTMGVRSMNSLKAYGRDILVWMRFLADRRDGKSLWRADRDDIAAFHEARRLSAPPHRVSATSWNRSIAALDKLYRWAVEESLILAAPFTYRQFWSRSPTGKAARTVSANCAKESGARSGDMRFLDLARYLLFRDVGLRGRLPDGREDPTWRGRNSERNALFAELLITTGLRLQEGSSLLANELPGPDASGDPAIRSCLFHLAPSTAKGGKGRDIRLPLRLVKQLHHYVGVERANAAARYQIRDGVGRIARPILVAHHDRRSVIINGNDVATRVSVDGLTPSERARLVQDGALTPMSLWLTEGGLPMPMAAWEAVFRRASARCRRFGIDLDVTPHMLRHSFAVHMLTLLLHQQIGWVLDKRSESVSPAYRRLIGDPLLKLQRLMGHSRIESTYIYLDHLDESQGLVDAAVDRWGLDLALGDIPQ
jgi:integrase